MLSLRVEPIWFASDLEDAWLVLRECIPPYDLKPRSLRLVGCLSKPPYLCEYLTRVDNPMTYPADVAIASGAYMVRQFDSDLQDAWLVLCGCTPPLDLRL